MTARINSIDAPACQSDGQKLALFSLEKPALLDQNALLKGGQTFTKGNFGQFGNTFGV